MRDPSNWQNDPSRWQPDNGNDAWDNPPPARPDYPRASGYPPPQQGYPGNAGSPQGPMQDPNYPPYPAQRPNYPDTPMPAQPPYPAQPYANNGYPPQNDGYPPQPYNGGYPPQQQPPWAGQPGWGGQPGPFRDSRPSGPNRGQGGAPFQEPIPSRPYRTQAAGPYRDPVPSGPYQTRTAAPGTGYYPPAGAYSEAMPSRAYRDPSRAQPIYRPEASVPYRYRSPASPSAIATQQGSEAAYAAGQEHIARRSRRRGSSSWNLPVEHIVLGAGIVALLLATTQPWGTNNAGHNTALNTQAAYVVIAMIAGLSTLLMLLNKRVGLLAVSGFLAFFVVPLVLAAAIGGSITLARLPIVPPIINPVDLSSWDRGFYIWWAGILFVMVGLALELMVPRKKETADI